MCSGIPIKLLNFSDLTKFLVLNFHAEHHIFNGLDTWLLGAVNKLSKNNRSIVQQISEIFTKIIENYMMNSENDMRMGLSVCYMQYEFRK